MDKLEKLQDQWERLWTDEDIPYWVGERACRLHEAIVEEEVKKALREKPAGY